MQIHIFSTMVVSKTQQCKQMAESLLGLRRLLDGRPFCYCEGGFVVDGLGVDGVVERGLVAEGAAGGGAEMPEEVL